MEIMTYIIDKALIMIPVLWIIGRIIKGIPAIPDWTIPLALLMFGIAGSMWIIGMNAEAALQGVLVTGAAVYGNQVVKQVGESIHSA